MDVEPGEETRGERADGGEEAGGLAPAGEPTASDAAAAETTPPAEPAGDSAAAGAVFEHRHPNALRLELAVGGAVLGGLTLAALLAASLVVFVGRLPSWLLAAVVAVPLALVFPLLVFPRWRHRRYSYRVDHRGLEIRKGVWFRSHRFIPHTRLQHTDIAQGPLERQVGLANLIVHTAGTHEARTTVSGLALDTARELRDRLTADAAASAGGADDGV